MKIAPNVHEQMKSDIATVVREEKTGNEVKAIVTRIHYCVPLSEAQWQRLNAINSRGDDRWDEVYGKLKKIGADDVEYTTRFGRNIFFSLKGRASVVKTLKALRKIVG